MSLLSLKKYRSQFRIRIKPSVPKSELAAAIAEHFAAIPDPEEDEVINKFLFTLQKNRTICSETEESGDEPLNKKVSLSLKKKSTTNHDTTETKTSEDLLVINNQKNALQSNTKKNVKKNNSTTKVESKFVCIKV